MDTTPEREYRIQPELRRCCVYVLVSGVVIAFVARWVNQFGPNQGIGGIVLGGILYSAQVVLSSVAFRWRLRLDERGIARRMLFRWDLWTWEELASGRIRKVRGPKLLDPDRPWWRRTLAWGLMLHADMMTVAKEINAHYRLPPPPEVSDTIKIKYGFRKSAVLDKDGIHLTVGKNANDYSWHDVQWILIKREDPVCRYFKSLVIVLPDREIELQFVTHQGGTSPTWKGATAEELNEFLLSKIPAGKVDVSILGEPPSTKMAIQRQSVEAEKMKRFAAILYVFMVVLSVSWLLAFGRNRGFWVFILLAVLIGFYSFLPAFVFRGTRVRPLLEGIVGYQGTGYGTHCIPDRSRCAVLSDPWLNPFAASLHAFSPSNRPAFPA